MAEQIPQNDVFEGNREEQKGMVDEKYKTELIRELERFAPWAAALGVISLIVSIFGTLYSFMILPAGGIIIVLLVYGIVIWLSLLWIKASKEARNYKENSEALLSFVDTMKLIAQIRVIIFIVSFVLALFIAILAYSNF